MQWSVTMATYTILCLKGFLRIEWSTGIPACKIDIVVQTNFIGYILACIVLVYVVTLSRFQYVNNSVH